MRTFWRLLQRVPFVVARRRSLEARQRNAFEIGRDYGRPACEQNWAPAIRSAIESAGFTVQEMPEDMTREQALAMLADLNQQIERMNIA